nr:ribonuclease H-like domain-containing protein [Tanacetum cinerariifolium]
MSYDEDKKCPLCAEEMDWTDQQLNPCKCGYEDSYLWGSYVWPTLYSSLRDANVRRWPVFYAAPVEEDDDKHKYTLHGFTWAFKPDAYYKLCQADPQRWSRAHCPLISYNHMTSNSVKSVNACTVLKRKLPVIMLAETYRAMVQDWIPCGHVIVVTRFLGLTDCVRFVADWFKKAKYQGTYTKSIHFVENMQEWEFLGHIHPAIPPRMDNQQPIRPKNTNHSHGDDENATNPAPVRPTPQALHTLSTIKLLILKKGEYDIWAMKMKHNLAHTYYPIWEVIQKGNGHVQVSTDTNRQIRVLPPKTAEEFLARERERKARTTLLMAIPEDHLAKFHKITDAKEMWEVIKSKFGGNDESKNMQKYIPKQQFKGFSVSNSEGLHKGYDSSPQLDHEDLEQVDEFDLEEMDLKWQVAMISTRLKKFYKKTGRKCILMPKNQLDLTRPKLSALMATIKDTLLESGDQKEIKKDEHKAMVTIDGEGVDWTGHIEEDTENYALMAFNSSNSGSDTETSAKDKSGLGYGTQIHEGALSYENEIFERIYMHPKSDFRIDESKFTYGPKQSKTSESNVKTNTLDSCESNYSVETLASVPKPVETRPKAANLHQTLKGKCIVDSGCSRHMTGNKAYIVEYQDFNYGPVAFGGSKGQITGKGKIKTEKLDFEDVYFVKELQHFNFFSVSQMCDKKNKVLFTNTECLVLSPDFKLPDENQVLLRVPRQNNMYSFNIENIVPSEDLACLIAKSTVDESNKWHMRIGHVKLKQTYKVKPCKRDIIELCASKEIKREYSNARTPQQNRVAERKNRTLIEAARTMLADSFLPNTFWAEAVSTACYVFNRHVNYA